MLKTLPVPVLRAMDRLGHDVGNAHQYGLVPVWLITERANTSTRLIAKMAGANAHNMYYNLYLCH